MGMSIATVSSSTTGRRSCASRRHRPVAVASHSRVTVLVSYALAAVHHLRLRARMGIGGGHPWLFHAVSLVAYFGVGVLLLQVLRRLASARRRRWRASLLRGAPGSRRGGGKYGRAERTVDGLSLLGAVLLYLRARERGTLQSWRGMVPLLAVVAAGMAARSRRSWPWCFLPAWKRPVPAAPEQPLLHRLRPLLPCRRGGDGGDAAGTERRHVDIARRGGGAGAGGAGIRRAIRDLSCHRGRVRAAAAVAEPSAGGLRPAGVTGGRLVHAAPRRRAGHRDRDGGAVRLVPAPGPRGGIRTVVGRDHTGSGEQSRRGHGPADGGTRSSSHRSDS